MDHRELVDAVKSCFRHSHISNEGYETFQQQWLSHIAAQHPIPYAEMGPKIWYFVCNLRLNIEEIAWCEP